MLIFGFLGEFSGGFKYKLRARPEPRKPILQPQAGRHVPPPRGPITFSEAKRKTRPGILTSKRMPYIESLGHKFKKDKKRALLLFGLNNCN